jgi:hypothetical protein
MLPTLAVTLTAGGAVDGSVRCGRGRAHLCFVSRRTADAAASRGRDANTWTQSIPTAPTASWTPSGRCGMEGGARNETNPSPQPADVPA